MEAVATANSEGWRVILTQETLTRWHAYVRKPGDAPFTYLLGSGWGDDPETAIHAALANGYDDEARKDIRHAGVVAPRLDLSALMPKAAPLKRRF